MSRKSFWLTGSERMPNMSRNVSLRWTNIGGCLVNFCQLNRNTEGDVTGIKILTKSLYALSVIMFWRKNVLDQQNWSNSEQQKLCLLRWGGGTSRGKRDTLRTLRYGNFNPTATATFKLKATFWKQHGSHAFTGRPHGKNNSEEPHWLKPSWSIHVVLCRSYPTAGTEYISLKT
jgi:hypothetical protein